MSPVPVFSDEMIQTSIDSDLGGVIMEAFMDASQLRNGRHIYLMIVLIFLYIVIIINLASTWSIVRSVVVTHNNTRKTMAAELFLNTGKMREIMNIIQLGAMVIADALLVWRCYIVWMKNKWLLAFFGAILLGEIVLIIMYIIHPQSYPNRVPINSFYYITLGVTVIATSMVVYRIITVSGRAGTVGRYRYAIEILVESGIIYSIPLLILGVIESLPNLTPSEINLLWEVDTYVLAFLVPVTWFRNASTSVEYLALYSFYFIVLRPRSSLFGMRIIAWYVHWATPESHGRNSCGNVLKLRNESIGLELDGRQTPSAARNDGALTPNYHCLTLSGGMESEFHNGFNIYPGRDLKLDFIAQIIIYVGWIALMSQSSPDAITGAAFDSNIGPLIVQAFLSGLYTFILYRTAWRCHILWLKNKWLLALFVVALIGEGVITVLATSMIIYRILTVSRDTGTTRTYGYIIEILVESGIIYSTSLLVVVVCFYLPDGNVSTEAYTYASSVLIPATGIAPTMIAERVVNSTEHDEEKWSQPISTLRFNHTTQRGETHQESHPVNHSPSPC
ncbi:hypothetical protein BDQ17DRAFT_1414415 [Cyathus striatus]|nr:hypothetical protein BDQ17DRAFT_1414415 [Cyathus striatus]